MSVTRTLKQYNFYPNTLMRFVERHPLLRKLEGWYEAPAGYKFKLSCRFNDILRCSLFEGRNSHHFRSCFNSYSNQHRNQPLKRCQNPNWAIIFTPDIHGSFLGRAFIHVEVTDGETRLIVDRVYGNVLNLHDILMIIGGLDLKVNVIAGNCDTYL